MEKEEKELKKLLNGEVVPETMADCEAGIFYFRSVEKNDIVEWIQNNRKKYIMVIQDILRKQNKKS